MMTRIIALFVSVFAPWVSASDWYVSPGASGTGTLLDPGSLTTAFSHTGWAASVAGGDTVWFRAGTYSGDYTAAFSGSATETPVTFRNYNRERAIIDGTLSLAVRTNLWFWGLEFIDSQKASRSVPFDTISGGGVGTKFINCLIHDCCIGLAGGPYEAYGNVMWNCGHGSTEHGIYWQNDGAVPKLMQNNLIGWASGFGIHCFSSGGLLNNLQAVGNAIWESGQPMNERKSAILMGGGTSVTNGLIDDNDCFMRGARGIEVGYSIDNKSIRISNNRTWAGRPLYVHASFTEMIVTNNVTMHNDDGNVYVSITTPFSEGPYVWDYNTYLCARYPGHSFTTNTVNMTFAEWKSAFDFDANSTYTETITNNFINQVIVRTNAYEAKRGHVIAWNFEQADTVSADVSSILSPGDRYEVRSAMNYFAGPVVSGVYGGGSIALPMTNLTVATALYWTPTLTPENITTNFGAFVLLGGLGPPPAPSRRNAAARPSL